MPRRSFFVAALVLLLLATTTPAAYTAPPPPGLQLLQSGPDGLSLEVVVPEPGRQPLAPGRNDPQQLELEGYLPGPDGLPIRELLVGLPPDGTFKLQAEPLAPVRLFQGPPPAVPTPRFPADRESAAMPSAWEWQPLDDQAISLPLASVVEEGFLRGWRIARLRLAPLAYLGDGRWELTPRLQVHILPDNSARTAQGTGPTAFDQLVTEMLLNGEQAVGWQTAQPPLLPVSPSSLPATTWRIGITADAIYRLTYEDMNNAGVPLTGAVPADFHLWSRGQEVALQEIGMEDGTFGPGDAFLFYGQGFHGTVQEEKYTDENVYWLSVDDSQPGLRMDPSSVAPSGSPPPVEWYSATVRSELNRTRWPRWSTDPGTSATWFWQRMFSGKSYGHQVELDALVPATHDALLNVEVAAANESSANPDHRLELRVNNNLVGTDSWDGMVGRAISLPFPSSFLREGANNYVQLFPTEDVGTQTIYSDWVEITYRRQTVVKNNRLDFNAPFAGDAAYSLSGFTTNQNLRLYDLSNPFDPRVLTGAVPQAAGATWNLLFTTTGTQGQPYLAVADAQIGNVPALTMFQPDLDLLSSTQGADEIMIVPDEFFAAIQPLANHRRAEGLRVRVARVKDLYALFNDGIVHPEAIRRFLAYAYQHWQKPAPAFALLVGDGHYNPKGYNPTTYGDPTPVYIPPYLDFLDPWEGEVPVDTRFAQIVGDDTFPDMALGRLPANSAQQVADVVAKIIAYENLAAPAWQDRIIFVADNIPDAGGNFEQVLERLSTDFVPARFPQERVFLTDFCGPPVVPPVPCPSATTALLDTWSQGAALLTFMGHGAVYRWTHEPLLLNTDVPSLTPGHGLPLVMTLNCLDGYWMMPANLPSSNDPTSMAEWMVMGVDHGSIANFSPAGLGTTPAEEIIARSVYNAMFLEGQRRLGELALAGQLTPIGFPAHLPQVSTFFGDPAGWLKLEQTRQQFAIEPTSSTVAAAAGHQAIRSFILTNLGDLEDGAELSVVRNKWPTTLSQKTVANLGSGHSTTFQVTVDVPAFVSPGEKDVAQVIVNSKSDPSVRASATLVTIAMGKVQSVYLPLVFRNSGRP